MGNDTKKLVYVNQTLGMGGAEVFLSDLLAALQKNSWQILVYTNNKNFSNLLSQKKIEVRSIKTVVDVIGDWKGLVKGLFLWPKLVKEYWQIAIKNNDADLFLMSGFIEKILLSPILKIVKKPSCWIEFGPMETVFSKFFGLPKLLYFLVKSLPKKVVTSSYHSRQSLESSAKISLAKLTTIPCGRHIPQLKSKVNTENVIACVSRLEEGKGQDLLIEAFSTIARGFPDHKLKIIGEGDFLSILREKVKKFKVEDKVMFAGRVESSLAEMSKAEIVVFPSVWPLEGFGLVMIEAMSLAKPVIAFNRGPGNEIIEDNETGLLAKDGSASDLANKIEIFLNDRALAQNLGKKARHVFLANYRIEPVAVQYEQVFLEVIADHKAQSALVQN